MALLTKTSSAIHFFVRMDFLKSQTAKDLPWKHSDIYVGRASDTLGEVMSLMKRAHVHSVPVLGDDNVVLGLLDWNDVVHRLAGLIRNSSSSKGKRQSRSTFPLDNQTFFQTPAAEAVNLSGRNPYKPLPETSTLLEVVTKLINEPIERVALINAKNEVTHIVSPSSIMKALARAVREKPDLLPMGSTPVSKLNVGPRGGEIVTIDSRHTTGLAFKTLAQQKVSGAPVVDCTHGDEFIGNLSTSDAFHLRADLADLENPVNDFVFDIRSHTTKAIMPAISVAEETTFAKAIQKVVAVGMHRLYITDKNRRVVGVMSLKDFFRVICAGADGDKPAPPAEPST